jgi:hypothetical protein
MKYFKKNNELFQAYRLVFKNNSLVLKYLRIIEGEFFNYYGIHSRINIFKFLYFFLKNFFVYRNIIYKNPYDFNPEKVIFVNTVDYLFNDNCRPLIDALNSRGLRSSLIKYDSSSLIFFINLKFFKFYFCKEVWFSFHNLIITLYIQQFVLPRVFFLLKVLDRFNFNDKVFITADPADLLSRCVYYISQEGNSKFILQQSGPVFEETVEWSSICCDLISCWNRDKVFFDKLGFNSVSFFPPRFYYINEIQMNPFMDVVILLPWFHDDVKREMEKLINEIIFYLNNSLYIKPFIKFHPAGKMNLGLDSSFYSIVTDSDIKKVLPSAKRVLHFGSTVYFDCIYLNLKCGLLNFNKILNVEFFHSDNFVTFEINSFSDLNYFFNSEIPPFESPIYERDFVDFVVNYSNDGL